MKTTLRQGLEREIERILERISMLQQHEKEYLQDELILNASERRSQYLVLEMVVNNLKKLLEK